MCWRGHGNGWYSVSWGDRGAGIRPAGSRGDSRRPSPAADRPAPAGGRQFGKNHAARGDRSETCRMTCAIEYGFSPAPSEPGKESSRQKQCRIGHLAVSTRPRRFLRKASMMTSSRWRLFAEMLALFVFGSFLSATAAEPLTDNDKAAMLLAAGQRAWQEKNYPFAIDRFKEFLRTYGGHKDAVLARYGLGISLVEGPQKDFPAAIEALQA